MLSRRMRSEEAEEMRRPSDWSPEGCMGEQELGGHSICGQMVEAEHQRQSILRQVRQRTINESILLCHYPVLMSRLHYSRVVSIHEM